MLPDIELVSDQVHRAWIESKLKQGVTSRKAEDGEELIVPYADLSEKAKELDRATVRAVYAAITACAVTEQPIVNLHGFPAKLFGSGGTLGSVGPFGIKIFTAPDIADDVLEFRDSIDGRLLAKVINVGRA